MALTNNQVAGKWTGGDLIIRIFDGKIFLMQLSGDGGIVPRGRALVGNTEAGYVAPATPLTTAEIATIEPSDSWGTAKPQSFVTPTGYTIVTKGNTPIYYPDALLAENPDLANNEEVAGRSADTLLTKIWAWVKANPVQASLAGFAIYVFIIEPLVLKVKPKKRLLAGLFS